MRKIILLLTSLLLLLSCTPQQDPSGPQLPRLQLPTLTLPPTTVPAAGVTVTSRSDDADTTRADTMEPSATEDLAPPTNIPTETISPSTTEGIVTPTQETAAVECVPNPNWGYFEEVRPGDTLSAFSRYTGLSIAAIKTANCLPNDDINAGDTLRFSIPVVRPVTPPSPSVTPPTIEPTAEPTDIPTTEPTAEPTQTPTIEPTDEPPAEPTDVVEATPPPTGPGDPTLDVQPKFDVAGRPFTIIIKYFPIGQPIQLIIRYGLTGEPVDIQTLTPDEDGHVTYVHQSPPDARTGSYNIEAISGGVSESGAFEILSPTSTAAAAEPASTMTPTPNATTEP